MPVCLGCGVDKNSTEFYARCRRCKTCVCAERKGYYVKNRASVLQRRHKYVAAGRHHAARNANIEKYRERERLYARSRQVQRNRYMRERRRKDLLFRKASRLRCDVNEILRTGNANVSRQRWLGCDGQRLRQHLEQQFAPGMTWENYGQWQVDHCKPLGLAANLDELLQLGHYTNLQPLWAQDNIIKGKKYDAD